MADELPNCFGDLKLYDPKCAECAGGYDPSFTESPSHMRTKCAVFEACGAQVRAKGAADRVKAAFQPTQPYAPTRTVTLSKGPMPQSVPVQMAQTPQQVQFVSPQNLQPAQAPVMVAAQMMPVNYGMPSYLSALEPKRMKKGKKWQSLTCEVGRSIGKSVGHSIAFFFDSVPWTGGDDDS